MGLYSTGVVTTFQLTFGIIFIAATVTIFAALLFDLKSAVLGTQLGALAIILFAALLNHRSYERLQSWFEVGSATILLLIATYLYNCCVFEAALSEDRDRRSLSTELPVVICVSVTSTVAWIVFAEGIDLLGIWSKASTTHGSVAASTGLALSIGMVGGLTAAFAGTGAIRWLPRHLLKGCAAIVMIGYSAFFLGRWSAPPL